MVNEFKLTMVHFASPLMSVPLGSKQSWGLAGLQRDKAPVEWLRSESGNPTEWMDAWAVATKTNAKVWLIA